MNYTDWVVLVVTNILTAIFSLITDLFLLFVNLLLSVILVPLSLLPAPAFMASGGLQTLFGAVPSEVWYFAHNLQLGGCLAMFGGAVVFRLGRKVATLFQW